VAAALTALRAWHIAGARVDAAPFGSFDAWSHRVREPLIWLGRADPCGTVAKVREDAPKLATLLTILLQWKEALGTGSAHMMREIISAAVARPDFHNALLAVAGGKRSVTIVSDAGSKRMKAKSSTDSVSSVTEWSTDTRCGD
jgi:putative DNA primase/helicase